MKIVRNILICGMGAVLLNACKKTPATQPLDGAGQTLVKFVYADGGNNPNGIPDTLNGKFAGFAMQNLELSSDPQKLIIADIRRDVPNSAELDKPMTIVVEYDPGAVSAYDPSLTPLPLDAFIPDPAIPLTGNEFTINLKPGEFAKEISVTIPDVTALDLTNNYGIGLTIKSVDANGKISTLQKTMVVQIGTNNDYDGIYRLYASFARADQPTYAGVNESPAGYYQPYYLVTVGPNSVDASINTAAYGIVSTQIIYVIGSGYTYFTGVAPRLNVEKTNNAVTVSEGVAAVGTSVAFTQSAAELAASKYYPNGITGVANSEGKKTIVAHFKWTSGTVDRIAKDTFVYIQPR